ncbi:hypothetical protein GPECTOR_95g681 [Gonium pectorale]|uniref:Uncharacterized protein n=1 Tax=Gonium pectorale TaxID=33097 RepID=A0A150G0B7_GONPE|nr:hypothetical protein GPECTOR_95g681 [Gonium pectorale]|eukprot:KXZ43292.1 hypothetical protein GPECTOR_95g681 [Gonium pectorale]
MADIPTVSQSERMFWFGFGLSERLASACAADHAGQDFASYSALVQFALGQEAHALAARQNRTALRSSSVARQADRDEPAPPAKKAKADRDEPAPPAKKAKVARPAAAQAAAASAAPRDAKSKYLSRMKCYGCGEFGHKHEHFPAPKRPYPGKGKGHGKAAAAAAAAAAADAELDLEALD